MPAGSPGEWCTFHEQVHPYGAFDERCRTFDQPPPGPGVAGWVKRLLVCWWKHRTRRLAAGVYVSHECRSCSSWRR